MRKRSGKSFFYTHGLAISNLNLILKGARTMKKFKLIASAAICTATALNALSFTAAAEDTVYGTMNIPYADFYAAEIGDAYEVDAVSSATTSKWSMNSTGSFAEDGSWTAGGLVAGTYNDGKGTILGVTYPVAVSASDVDFLTENYGFTALDSAPAAYKEVTVSGSDITVSKTVDTNGETNVTGTASVNTSSRYGDYQLSVKNYPTNCDIYGIIVDTQEGGQYALRHLENIWRNGEISWSVGITTTEAHGNTLSYEDYVSSIGQTVTGIRYITLDGVTNVTIDPSAYLPIKTDGTVAAENSTSGDGSTTYTTTGFPEDYVLSASVGDGFTVANGTISYTGAQPGTYTLTVSDGNGVYAPVTASFTLSTDEIPVKYSDGALVAADGYTDEDAANFIKNITSVTVNDTAYSTGRRGVTIVNSDGTIDFEAEGNDGPVFDGSGNYTFSIASTGYNNTYDFALPESTDDDTTASDDTTSSGDTTASTSDDSTATTTTAGSSSSASATTTTTASSKTTTTTGKKADSPQTGDAGAAIPLSLIAATGAAAFVLRKKKND